MCLSGKAKNKRQGELQMVFDNRTVYNDFGNKIGVIESQSRDFFRTTIKGGLLAPNIRIEIKTYVPQKTHDLDFWWGKTRLVQYLELDNRVYISINKFQTKQTVKILNQIAMLISVPFTAKLVKKNIQIAYAGDMRAFDCGAELIMINLSSRTIVQYKDVIVFTPE
jgi:hypothetical protein